MLECSTMTLTRQNYALKVKIEFLFSINSDNIGLMDYLSNFYHSICLKIKHLRKKIKLEMFML